ncbi:hypothetical protein C5S36_03515 [Candidatus Methanophagaceae archaeon]|nr:hypothetical protein C5S36_03515 [Methanophagales archaeon]
MKNQVNESEIETEKKIRIEKRKEFRAYYSQQRKVILSILISMYIVLNIIASILTTYYYFVNIVLYIGIIMLVIISGIIVTIVYENNYFWAFLSSIIIGVIPTIEIVIGLAVAKLEGINLILVIISLIFSVCLIFIPTVLVHYKLKRSKTNKLKEQE